MAIKIQGTTIINDETSFVSLAGTGALKLPVGTTAQGGAISAAAGMIRFNSDDTVFEAYNGTAWGDVHTSVGDVSFAGTNHGGVTWDTSEDEFLFAEGSRIDFGGGANIRRESDGILRITGATADDTYFNFSNNLIFYRGGFAAAQMMIDGSTQRFHTYGKLTVSNNIELDDSDGSTNKMIILGTGNDLKIYHFGNSFIENDGTSDLLIRNSANDYDVKIQSDNGSGGIANYFVADGSVGAAEMHWGDYSTNGGADGGVKLATNASGVTITGTATATAFSGDGSALTNLPSSADEYARTIALLGL